MRRFTRLRTATALIQLDQVLPFSSGRSRFSSQKKSKYEASATFHSGDHAARLVGDHGVSSDAIGPELGQERFGGLFPRVKIVAGTLPFEAQYTLAVSAPTRLNKKDGKDALANGIVATLRINVASYPEGSSAVEA